MISFGGLTSTLRVTEYKINVIDLDYIELGKKLVPTDNIVAINSNFIHKCFDGYEQFIAKPKRIKKIVSHKSSKRGGIHAGDCSVFNACIEFTVILESNNTTIRYFPRSGNIQVFTRDNIIQYFLKYLHEYPEFTSVELVGDPRILLDNYKFCVILLDKMINIYKLHEVLKSNEYGDVSPFRILYAKSDLSDVHSKIAIIFENKIQIHIWPKSGKANIFGTKDYTSAKKIYDYLLALFTKECDTIIRDVPISDK